MKQIIFLTLAIIGIATHTTYPGFGSPYGSQQGLFVPQVTEIKSISSANDVLYTRFCKAVCMLYVPMKKTCGLNNEVYYNECQARCDRISVDDARLMFNDKCCCLPGSEYIDSSWVLADNDLAASPVVTSEAGQIKSSSFCISKLSPATAITGNINIFAIPPCLSTCLGIDSKADLKFIGDSSAFVEKCDDGIQET